MHNLLKIYINLHNFTQILFKQGVDYLRGKRAVEQQDVRVLKLWNGREVEQRGVQVGDGLGGTIKGEWGSHKGRLEAYRSGFWKGSA